MLEQKIQELTAAVETLTEVIRNAGVGQTAAATGEAQPEKQKRTRKPKEDAPAPEPEVAASEPATDDAATDAGDEPDEFDFSGDIEAVVEEVTIETLRLAIRDAIAKGGKEQEAEYRKKVGATLAGFKVKTLPELAESDYPAVLAKLRAIK